MSDSCDILDSSFAHSAASQIQSMANEANDALKVHTLTINSTDLDEHLPSIHRLARQVFEPKVATSDYNVSPSIAPQMQLDSWKERLLMPNATLMYIHNDNPNLDQSENATNTLGSDNPILGFVLNHPRKLPDTEQADVSYHVYLAAVLPSARGKGVFATLLAGTKRRARKAGHEWLTLRTQPKRFAQMYGILSKPGSGWSVLERKTTDQGEETVLFKTSTGV